ncbi:MAG TPA: hypothetical protein VFA20_27935 [Myxococcaceae bacterium]|nr:hypothetical protein [Myxococcaceae bacterium]
MSPDPDLDSHPDSDPPGVRRAAADGAAQLVAWDLKLPQGASRMRQFVFGLWLPVVVARSVLRDARVRARWLRFGGAQVAATVLVAALALWVGGSDGGDDKEVSEATKGAVAELRHRVDDRAAELEGRAAPADRALVRAQRSLVNDRLDRLEQRLEGRGERGVPAPDELPAFVSRALDDAGMERAAALRTQLTGAADDIDGEKVKEVLQQRIGEALSGKPGPKQEPSFDLGEAKALDARKLQQDIEKKAQAGAAANGEPTEDEDVDAAAARLLGSIRRKPAAPLSPEQVAKARQVRAELKVAALSALSAAEQKLEQARPWSSRLAALGVSWHVLGWLVALWGALYGAQFVVIALCRDYHAELSREACLLTGLAPEDPPRAPRPRIDVRWAVLRVKRQFRGWWVITLGIPVCWLIGLPFPGDSVRNALIAGWVLYWQAVFAASKSQRAWVDEFVAPAPWFLRGWRWLCDKVWPFWLAGGGVYLRIWERSARSLYAPAECVEQQPAAFAGLTLFRLVGSTPLLKIFVRPLVPVASALLLEAYREHHPTRTAPPVLMAEPVVPAAPATSG